MNSPLLRKIIVDIDVATNPTVRDMFTRREAADEILPFAGKLKLARWINGVGETKTIELTGPADDLYRFFAAFLIDEAPQVYGLTYAD